MIATEFDPGRGFPIRPTVDGFFNFGVPKRVFFVKQLQGVHLSIARDLCAVIGDRLRTTYHMPYARVSFLGIPAASCGVPPKERGEGRRRAGGGP